MKAGKVLTMKAVALGVAVMFIAASCGSSDSSSGGRTKNSALCFPTQEDKDAAIEAAQAELDAANATDTTSAAGGYRRPAVRSMSGDTTVPPDSTVVAADETTDTSVPSSDSTVPSDSTVVDSGPNIPMLEQALADAQNQPLCDAVDASAAEMVDMQCVISLSYNGEAVVVDACAEATRIVFGDGSNGGAFPFALVVPIDSAVQYTIYVGEQVVMEGTYTGSEGPVSVTGEYQVEAQSSTETTPGEASGCTATFTSTGVSWDCPNGELFNAAIEDMSNPGVYPLVECASSGSFTVAEGQQFWFNFFLVNGTQTFIDGWNTDRELNVPVGFSVPEDTEGVCTASAVESFAWDSLPLSGSLDEQARTYSFTVPEDLGSSVYLQLASDNDFGAWDESESLSFEGECPSTCTQSMVAELAPGEYFFRVSTSSAAVTWLSNVEISAVLTVLPVLPFLYTSDGSETSYLLNLSEAQTVTLTATAGQTCLRSEDNRSENGFADPELWIFSGNYEVDEYDDNSGRGEGNCSASLIEMQLEPGMYWVGVVDDDSEGVSITLGSSVELTTVGDITWNLTSTSASPDTTFEIVVPAGGSWFRANTVLDQTVVETSDEATGEFIDGTGCWIDDDGRCADSFLVLLDANGDEVISDDDGGMQYSSSTSNGVITRTWANYYASDFFVFLNEGTYTLAVMDCCGPWEGEVPSTDTYQVNFGFGSYTATEAPEAEVVIDENPTIPTSVEQPKLADAQLSAAGSASTSIAEGVDSMVCDTSCIEGLFASAGLEDGTISISAGGESVEVRKGQEKALILIGENASVITARAVSADGSKTATLSMKLNRADAAMEKAMQDKVASGSFQSAAESETSTSGSSNSIYIYVLIALLILVAIGYIRRKKATETK